MRTYKVLPFSRDLGWWSGVIAPCTIGQYLVGRGREGAHLKYRADPGM